VPAHTCGRRAPWEAAASPVRHVVAGAKAGLLLILSHFEVEWFHFDRELEHLSRMGICGCRALPSSTTPSWRRDRRDACGCVVVWEREHGDTGG